MSDGILKHMTIDQVRRFDPKIVLCPVGSVEPHGSALPYGTDCYQVEGVAFRAAELANARDAHVLVYPTQQISCNANGHGFPFSCRIAPSTLVQIVSDVVQSLWENGIDKVVILNGHGGNTGTLRMALRELSHHRGLDGGPFVCMVEARHDAGIIEHPSVHGGESEVSRMMHLKGDLVHTEEFHDQPFARPVVKSLHSPGVFFVKPWHAFVPESAGGDTRKSSAEKGRRIIEQSAEHLAELLVELSAARMTKTFPYPES